MIKTIVSWFTGSEEPKVELFYRSREVWTYRHTDPITKRASTRPVLIFRKASDGMFWGLPLAKTSTNGKALYVPRLNGKKVPVLAQMRTLKAERLVRKLGTAGEKEFGVLAASIVRVLAEAVPVPKRPVRRAKVYALKSVPMRAQVSPFSPMYVLQPR